MDNREWVRRARAGEAGAFEQLKKIYGRRALFLAERLLLDKQEAIKASEASFASVKHKLSRLKEDDLFARWLEWTVARECRERLRKRAPGLFVERKRGFSTVEDLPLSPRRRSPLPEDEAVLEEVVAAVDSLPVLQRFPLLYARYCGYSEAETAAFMELSPETVTFRIRAGENALAEALQSVRGAEHSGILDVFEGLNEYGRSDLFFEEEEPALYAPTETEEEYEDEEEEEGRSPVLAILIAVSALLLAAVIAFLIWTLRDRHDKKKAAGQVPVSASVSVSAAASVPGRPSVTAIPAAARTPAPTFTPVPTFTPAPTAVPADVSGLDYAPEENEWLPEPRAAYICVQGTMNVRKGPTTKYKSLGTMSAGQQVIAYAVKDSWYLVEYLPGKFGWGSGKYILGGFMFEDGTNGNLAGITMPEGELGSIEVRTVTASEGAKLYRDPSENGTVSETEEYGTRVCALTEEKGWVFVNHSGCFGWLKEGSFDTSNIIELENGEYFYEIEEETDWEESGSAVRVEGTILMQEYITPENAEKFLTGETVKTKKGTKLKPGFAVYEKSAEEAEPGIAAEISLNEGERRFVYDAEQKLYALYDHSAPTLYTVKETELIVRADAAVTDGCYFPVYDTGVPPYGTVDEEGLYHCEGRRLDDYVKFLKSRGVYTGLKGRISLKNGQITGLVIESGE